ncbi:MAG: histidine phosphatase family protein [Acidimicrobiia bacterium]|nr:histidine phosphatase family protein [Acidimicrobiia bacterium]
MVTLLLVRHAEAEGNAERRFIGQTDVPLTGHGHRQVERLTDRLAALPISRVVSSDLRRCRDTVGPTADRLGLDLETDRRLREIENGAWNGLLPEEIEAGWPDLFSRYRAGEDVYRPRGERWADVTERVSQALADIAGAGSDGDVVVVGTHAGPTLAALRWATGVPLDGNVFGGPFDGIGNASISALSFPGPRLARYNDAAHLD